MDAVPPLDYGQLGAELIRALRGKRSQMALSRRLGYKTNVVYLWEAQKGAPTGVGFFRLAERVGVDVRHALEQFYRTPPPWLRDHEPVSVSGVAALLDLDTGVVEGVVQATVGLNGATHQLLHVSIPGYVARHEQRFAA